MKEEEEEEEERWEEGRGEMTVKEKGEGDRQARGKREITFVKS